VDCHGYMFPAILPASTGDRANSHFVAKVGGGRARHPSADLFWNSEFHMLRLSTDETTAPALMNSEYRTNPDDRTNPGTRMNSGNQVMHLSGVQSAPALIDQVHDRLLAAIIDGTLPPGERLTQESVAALLGVSRQPVSHALQVLRRRGLLIETVKRGLAVAPIDGQRIRDLYQVREALDGLAARLAAIRAQAGHVRPSDRAEATVLVEKGKALAPAGSLPQLIAADVAFHSLIYRLSGNAAIAETVAEQWPHFMRSMGQVLAEPEARTRVWSEHETILVAILDGNPAKAEVAACRHASRTGDETARRLEIQAKVTPDITQTKIA
jgi:DNA-binding GntR family transcriptional regulator